MQVNSYLEILAPDAFIRGLQQKYALRRRSANNYMLCGIRRSVRGSNHPCQRPSIQEELLDSIAGLAARIETAEDAVEVSGCAVLAIAVFIGPFGKKSTKAVADVLTPVIVCTVLGISST